jgi:hypothetical protein
MIDKDLIKKLKDSKSGTLQAIGNDLSKFNLISELDPEMSIVRLRRALDHIIRRLTVQADLVAGTKPLDQLIDELQRKNVIPGIIVKHCRVIKEFGNLAAHGAVPVDNFGEVSNLTNVELDICSNSTEVILKWFLDKILNDLNEKNTFRIIDLPEINYDMIKQTVGIDKLIYPETFWPNYQTCYQWFERNPHIYTLLFDESTSQIIGYINAMPLELDIYTEIENGGFIDIDIPASKIREYDLPDFYPLYFASIAIHPSYHNTNAFRALYGGFINKLISFARNDIFISEIMSDAVSDEGKKLCRYTGMREIRKTTHNSSIFKVTLLPPALRITTKEGKLLLQYYNEKYEFFKDLF